MIFLFDFSRFDCNERLRVLNRILHWSWVLIALNAILTGSELVLYLYSKTTWVDWMLCDKLDLGNYCK